MDYETYQERVLARCSHRWYGEKLALEDFKEAMKEFVEAGNRLDRVKKALMYGREFFYDFAGDSFIDEDDQTIPSIPERDQRICHAILGAATEGVEMVEAMFDYFFVEDSSKGQFDRVNLQEEFGDAEWYRALFLDAVGQTDEANRIQNDTKLELRFGSTFTEDGANNRDLAAERRSLEG